MTSYFPDVNVWIALSVLAHPHNNLGWNWKTLLRADDRILISRYTQLGILRLPTNRAVMGDQTLTIGKASAVYDQWLGDPQVEFCTEPRGVEESFR